MNQAKRVVLPFGQSLPVAANLFGQPLPTLSPAAFEILKPLLAIDTTHFTKAERDRFSKAIADVDNAVRQILELFRENAQPQIGPALRAARYLPPDQRREMARLETETAKLRQERLVNLIAILVHSYADAIMVGPRALPGLLAKAKKQQTAKASAAISDNSDRGRQIVYGCIRDLLSKRSVRHGKPSTKEIQKAADKAVKALPAGIKRPRLGERTVRKYRAEYFREIK
jgi:hypothetical protein